PGESILFAQIKAGVSNRQDFIRWWGATNLPANLQVRFYALLGVGSDMDAVQLLDPQGRLVDRVDFGQALEGHTFVYQPESGEFGSFSARGENLAFKAVLADD